MAHFVRGGLTDEDLRRRITPRSFLDDSLDLPSISVGREGRTLTEAPAEVVPDTPSFVDRVGGAVSSAAGSVFRGAGRAALGFARGAAEGLDPDRPRREGLRARAELDRAQAEGIELKNLGQKLAAFGALRSSLTPEAAGEQGKLLASQLARIMGEKNAQLILDISDEGFAFDPNRLIAIGAQLQGDPDTASAAMGIVLNEEARKRAPALVKPLANMLAAAAETQPELFERFAKDGFTVSEIKEINRTVSKGAKGVQIQEELLNDLQFTDIANTLSSAIGRNIVPDSTFTKTQAAFLKKRAEKTGELEAKAAAPPTPEKPKFQRAGNAVTRDGVNLGIAFFDQRTGKTFTMQNGVPVEVPEGTTTRTAAEQGPPSAFDAPGEIEARDAARRARAATGTLTAVRGLISTASQLPHEAFGGRGELAFKAGGFISQINDTLGQGVTKLLAGGATQDEIAGFRLEAQGLIAKLIGPIAGEEGTRKSDTERRLVAEAVRVKDQPDATLSQVLAGLNAAWAMTIIDIDRDSIIGGIRSELDFTVERDHDIMVERLVDGGMPISLVRSVMDRLIEQREELARTGAKPNFTTEPRVQ